VRARFWWQAPTRKPAGIGGRANDGFCGSGHRHPESEHFDVRGRPRAIETLDVAAEQVLKRRSSLGALASRVEQTLNDLMLNVENLSAADSRIRDADLAVETANLTQAQIIQEAGISILSQANVVPRQALTLLNNR
jgi:flagellin-like hook-associated protein FlgL